MRRSICIFIILTAGTVLLFGLNLTVGSVRIPFPDVLEILSGQYTGKDSWR